MKLIHWTLDHPIAVSMFYFAMLIIGIVCFSMIPIELSPNIELPQLTVSAGWTNTSPVTMEAQDKYITPICLIIELYNLIWK